jgi:hypothetical protein
MLQAGRSRVQVPMRSLDFFNWPNPDPGVNSASNRNEYQDNSWNILGGKGRPARKANNLTAIYEPTVKVMWDP